MGYLDLTGKTAVEKAKHIIKRSVWTDLVTSEKRLCIYFRPSRKTPNDIVSEEVLQIDCHVPATQDYMAYRIQKRVYELLQRYEKSGRIFYYDGMLGELPTLSNFICIGSRYIFKAVV